MIFKIEHVRSSEVLQFNDRLRSAVTDMQNNCGLSVEVQYQTSVIEDGYEHFVVYSALVIGRLKVEEDLT